MKSQQKQNENQVITQEEQLKIRSIENKVPFLKKHHDWECVTELRASINYTAMSQL